MSRLLSWFCSKKGRTFTHFCVGSAALVAFNSKCGIHGPFLAKMKDICQLYNKGKPRDLSPEVTEMVEKVLHDSSLDQDQKKNINFFYIVGHEPFHAGGLDSPWGAIIGIPLFFEGLNNININSLRLYGRETMDWIIDGRDLLDSLTISDNAKKFAIMREIYSCSFYDSLQNGVIAAGSIVLSARIAQKMNVVSNAFEKLTIKQRLVRYFGFYFMGYILYRLLKDPLIHFSDNKADTKAAETGPEYLDGGIEFYKKTLSKNKALDELSQSRLRRAYDDHGNEYHLLLVPKLPLTKRLENLQKLKKEQLTSTTAEVATAV